MAGYQRSRRRRAVFFLIIFLVTLFGGVLLSVGRFLPLLYHVLVPSKSKIATAGIDQRVNILLLGIGGGSHDGPNLTDTIIFSSIDPKTNRVSLVSIPRDLWIPELHGKINTAYAIGEEKKHGDGLILAKAVVARILNQDVPYAFRIDFSGFEKAVDEVGGLTITVDRTFDDYQYPIEGKENDLCGKTQAEIDQEATASATLTDNELYPCRYEHLHFNAGTQTMNGETALKYVRSRHAIGVEGTDFARSKRQQKVIEAFKAKLFSAGTLLNPARIISLYSILQGSIDTDITQDELPDFIHLAEKMKNAKTENIVMDTGDATRPGLLINPPTVGSQAAAFDYEWVLSPRVGLGNYSEIQQYVSCEMKKNNCTLKNLPSQ